MRLLGRISVPLIFIAALIAIYLAGAYGLSPFITPCPDEPEFDIVEEAWLVILQDYVDIEELDLNTVSGEAVRGMIGALDDPHSAYYSAEQYETIKNRHIEGLYGGIGAVLSIIDGNLTVVSLIEDAPAERGGLMPGDRILGVDGESTWGMSLDDAVDRISGEPGTDVTLLVIHEGSNEEETIVITREEIKLPSIYTEMLPDNIAHIEISRFSSHTGNELATELERLLENDLDGIVLDLRDNTGGVLAAAVKTASQFLEEGLVTYAIYSGDKREDWEVEKGGIATDIPLAILVNANTASAGEVVAGALQDHERGRLIGTQTYGKGSVNHHRQLSDGSAIYISIARWYTPDGRQIEGNGLTPDDEVEITVEDIEQKNDPQLDRAIEYIKSQL